MIIVLEGPDCVGKTTVAKKLAAALKESGKFSEVEHVAFPRRGDDGMRLLQCPSTSSVEARHCLFAADRLMFSEHMLKFKGDDRALVVDRYTASGLVYTLAASRQGLASRLSAWAQTVDSKACPPDKTFLLTVPEKVRSQRALDRSRSGGTFDPVDGDSELQTRIAELFSQLPLEQINADRSPAPIVEDIISRLIPKRE